MSEPRLRQGDIPSARYNVSRYHPISDGSVALAAHQSFFPKYLKDFKEGEEPVEYWELSSKDGRPEGYTRVTESGIPLTVRYGRVADFSKEYLASFIDAMAKTFADSNKITGKKAREKKILDWIGWTLTENRVISSVEINGFIIAGVMAEPSYDDLKRLCTDNNNRLHKDILETDKDKIFNGRRLFRVKDNSLRNLVPGAQENLANLGKQIIMEVHIGRAFAIERYGERKGVKPEYLLGETPDEKVFETYRKHYGGQLITTGLQKDFFKQAIGGNPDTRWWAFAVPISQLLEKARDYDRQLGERQSI